MPKLKLVTKPDFSDRYWQRLSGFQHGGKDTIAPLTISELPVAAASLPVGFILKDELPVPVAVQGVPPGENLLVSLEGKWLIDYVPLIYRAYPFSLMQGKEGKQLLCIDEESGLISDTDGERFFDENGEPSEAVKKVLNLLQHIHQNRIVTDRICDLIYRCGLIESWPIILPSQEGDKTIQGLFKISEQKLNQLDDEGFVSLRKAGALPMIYGQMSSMYHLPSLIKLAGARQNESVTNVEDLPDIEKMLGKDDDLFSFDLT